MTTRMGDWLIGMFVAGCIASGPANGAPPHGNGSLSVEVGTPDQPLTMRLYYATPPRMTADTAIVFVLHGARRDADRYRGIWAGYAERHGYLVVAPEFSRDDFPGSSRYQMGNLFNAAGDRKPAEDSAFAALERAFDAVRAHFGLNAQRYDLFGHSAGGQFVHRMVLFWPQARIRTAIAANAGTYTMPDHSAPLPYGLADAGLDKRDMARIFATDLIVMVGSEDNDPHHRALNRYSDAMAQGPHRLARAHTFMERARAAAAAAPIPLAWRLIVVDGVAHSPTGMAAAAAPLLGQTR
jgi:poly(3-hydroxybutyrate) depolymerase